VRPTRILLLGGEGQIGWELRRTLAPFGAVIAPPSAEVDLADPKRLIGAVREARPDIVVNAAAYTDVERAEDEPRRAEAINSVAPGVLAEEMVRAKGALVHFSTDYVFDGASAAPYREDDRTGPLNAYGATKLAGERAVQSAGGAALILRTSWVYSARRKNFLRTVLGLARSRPELNIVADQRGAPTWARSIAEATAAILARAWAPESGLASAAGLYHLSAAGETSWHGFAERIVACMTERDPGFPKAPVNPIATADYPTKAKRPAYSVLDNARLREAFGVALPDWRDQLAACLDDMVRTG